MTSLTTFTKVLVDKFGTILGVAVVVNNTTMNYGGKDKDCRQACISDHLVGGGVIDNTGALVYIEREFKAKESVKVYLNQGFTLDGWGKIHGTEVYNLIATGKLHNKVYVIGKSL